ncbi:MAG: hypothetical protein J6N15_11635 [Ruminiclostridium sp.]|nr:hypothetical protein [Ruminiclostridium sp.]
MKLFERKHSTERPRSTAAHKGSSIYRHDLQYIVLIQPSFIVTDLTLVSFYRNFTDKDDILRYYIDT